MTEYNQTKLYEDIEELVINDRGDTPLDFLTTDEVAVIVDKVLEYNKNRNIDTYVKDAISTESNDFAAIKRRVDSKGILRLLHATMGLATEAGEILDTLKKYIFYGKPIDIQNLKEEGGDISWYLAILCDELDYSFEDMLADNIVKLKKRYPDKFSNNNAINRDIDNELNHIK